jgi:hypothetical protein
MNIDPIPNVYFVAEPLESCGVHSISLVDAATVLRWIPLEVLRDAVLKGVCYSFNNQQFRAETLEEAESNLQLAAIGNGWHVIELPPKNTEKNLEAFLDGESEDEFLERQEGYFKKMTLEALEEYQGMYVWVENGYIKDSDTERGRLVKRIYEKEGMRTVFTVKVPQFEERHQIW